MEEGAMSTDLPEVPESAKQDPLFWLCATKAATERRDQNTRAAMPVAICTMLKARRFGSAGSLRERVGMDLL